MPLKSLFGLDADGMPVKDISHVLRRMYVPGSFLMERTPDIRKTTALYYEGIRGLLYAAAILSAIYTLQ